MFWIGFGGMLVALCMSVVSAADAASPTCELDGTPVPGFMVKSIGPAQFQALHAKVAPRGTGELWATIPWQTDLRTARQKSAREGKPILMWVMDGHPLGCT